MCSVSKILVTGGAGFIGSYLCEALSRSYKVTALDISDGYKIKHLKKINFIRGSIEDGKLMKSLIKNTDFIFHLAAIANPKIYVTEPLKVLNIDLKATLNILQLASKYDKKVFFTSTSEVYGKNPQLPWKEDANRVLGSTHINRWCYSSAKSVVEHYLYAYGFKFVIVRFFNIYGAKEDELGEGRVIPVFLKQFLNNEPVTIAGNGEQTRSFCYIDDTINAIIRLAFLKEAEGQAFNIGTDREISILGLAEKMKKIGNFKSEIQFVPYKELFGMGYEDIIKRVPDVSKIKKMTGWEATTLLEDGLKKTIKHYRR